MGSRIERFPRRLGLCVIICGISAAPSFLLGAAAGYDVPAMLVGVALFIILCVAIASSDAFERILSGPFVRRTLYIGVGTRVVLSVAFPFGWIVDLFGGGLSTQLVAQWLDEPKLFLGTLATTLVQGLLLSLILVAYMGIVYLAQRALLRPPVPEGFCRKCRYNLTGNVSGVCPECGTPVNAEKPRSGA